ncbi:MAG: DUF5320 domain-containing protein [Sedimentisphaerales bacterium]|nr:DUF5320 domain-containing protein [Sedimentisphaerales bacterium]
MPGGDRTGPAGMGPITGRAAGFCAGHPVPGYMNPAPGRGFWGAGRGFGRGRGMGRGWGFRGSGWGGWYGPGIVPPATLSTEQELQMLRQQSENLQQTLNEINERISEIQNQK